MRKAILLLLALVVFREEWCLFLTVRTLEMVEALVQDTETLAEIALLLIELLDLETDQLVGVVFLDILVTDISE